MQGIKMRLSHLDISSQLFFYWSVTFIEAPLGDNSVVGTIYKSRP